MKKHSMIKGIKCTLAILIILLWVLSIATLGVTTIIRESLGHIILVTEKTSSGTFYLDAFFPVIFPILITVSCFIFVIGCLGCCGAFTESQILLGWFFLSLLVTFSVELSAGIWRMVNYDLQYNKADLRQLKVNIDKYGSENPSIAWFTSAWKEVHRKFQCCGVDSYQDWLHSDYDLLKSCCPADEQNGLCLFQLIYMEGCGDKLLHSLHTSPYVAAIPYLTAGMGIAQVMAMILTLKLWLTFCFSEKTVAQEESQEHRNSVWTINHPDVLRIGVNGAPEGYCLSNVSSFSDPRYSNVKHITRYDRVCSNSNHARNKTITGVLNGDNTNAYHCGHHSRYHTTALWDENTTGSRDCHHHIFLEVDKQKTSRNKLLMKSKSQKERPSVGKHSHLSRNCNFFAQERASTFMAASLNSGSSSQAKALVNSETRSGITKERTIGVGATFSERNVQYPDNENASDTDSLESTLLSAGKNRYFELEKKPFLLDNSDKVTYESEQTPPKECSLYKQNIKSLKTECSQVMFNPAHTTDNCKVQDRDQIT